MGCKVSVKEHIQIDHQIHIMYNFYLREILLVYVHTLKTYSPITISWKIKNKTFIKKKSGSTSSIRFPHILIIRGATFEKRTPTKSKWE